MTTDPKDAEIARLTAELFEMTRSRDEWRNDFRAIEKAIVGDTGLSAMTVAVQARLFRPRAEKAEAERDAALAQVAMTVFCADCENTTTRTDDDRCSVCGSGRIMVGKAPSAALSRRDAQMRAEGRKEGLREAAELERGMNNGETAKAIRRAILAAAEREASP